VLGIVGVLDIPLIVVSVRLLRGIHPAVLTRTEGGTGLVDPWMRIGLLVSALALILLASWFMDLRVRGARLEDEVATLRRELEGAAREVA